MKKDYLKSLEKALNEYNVENKKEVLKKYAKRYDFGHDAGLTDDKIEEMLGDPVEVAKKLANVVDAVFAEKRDYDVSITLTTEDLEIVDSKDDGIHIELKELDLDDYTIEKDDKHLSIKRNKTNFFVSKIYGTVRIEIPKGLDITSYEINTVTSDIKAQELRADHIYLRSNNTDVEVSNIITNELRLETVSGDIVSNSIKAKDVHIETVSGDVKIDSLITEDLSVSTISGDVNIASAYVSEVKSNTVTGDIIINGESVGLNVKNSIKNTFGKIKRAFKNEKD